MKSFKFFLLGILITSTAALFSCKKEYIKNYGINKSLSAKEGDWNIAAFNYKSESSISGVSLNTTILEYGSYTFNTDASGWLVYTHNGDTNTTQFTYKANAQSLTVKIGLYTTSYALTWNEDKVKLVNEKTHYGSEPGEVITETETIYLQKK